MLIIASLLTLSALLNVMVPIIAPSGILADDLAAIVRLAAAVCWVGYFIAQARDDIQDLSAGNRDLIIREMRRLDRKRGAGSLDGALGPEGGRRRVHLKSCE